MLHKNQIFQRGLLKKQKVTQNLNLLFEEEPNPSNAIKGKLKNFSLFYNLKLLISIETFLKSSCETSKNVLKKDPISFLFEANDQKFIESKFIVEKFKSKYYIYLLNKEADLKLSFEDFFYAPQKEQTLPLVLSYSLPHKDSATESGAFGSVRLSGNEAIKTPFSSRIEEFLNELKVYDHLSKIKTNYIVKRIDSCSKEGEMYSKLERCESSLRKSSLY